MVRILACAFKEAFPSVPCYRDTVQLRARPLCHSIKNTIFGFQDASAFLATTFSSLRPQTPWFQTSWFRLHQMLAGTARTRVRLPQELQQVHQAGVRYTRCSVYRRIFVVTDVLLFAQQAADTDCPTSDTISNCARRLHR